MTVGPLHLKVGKRIAIFGDCKRGNATLALLKYKTGLR